MSGRKTSLWCTLLVAALAAAQTSTEWRDDEKNLAATRDLNRAYERLPFSREYEGVLDHCPIRLTWSIGPNTPVAWKGGVTGVFGNEIALVGGLWMPGRKNLANTYNVATGAYREIPPPPFETAYTQGAHDAASAYIVGGRSSGRQVARLSRDGGEWRWSLLPVLPEAEGKGRWLATSEIIPSKWLFLLSGTPTGKPSEDRAGEALPDWRLRLDRQGAQWEPMSPYPGGIRALVISAVARGKLYVFGGSHPDKEMRVIHSSLAKQFGLSAPYNGVPNFRDAYRYDPEKNRWSPIRGLPTPMIAGTGITVDDRYILLMGSYDQRTYRVGRSKSSQDPLWTGYGDRILCYDIERDNYSRVGVMVYGVCTCPWIKVGDRLYGFGGEPGHGYNVNTENVLQIATIERVKEK